MGKKRKFQVLLVAIVLLLSIVLVVRLSNTDDSGRNSVSSVIISSDIELEESGTEVESEAEPESLYDADTTAAEVIERVMNEYEVYPDQVSIVYRGLQNGDQYLLNEEEIFYAASTIKVAIAAIYVDLIEQGSLGWKSEIPYSDSYYEEGEGDITNLEKMSAYPVDELIYQMLIYSDNTATNVLAAYYTSTFEDYRSAIYELSGVEYIDPELYEGNYITAEVLAQILLIISENDRYDSIVEIMKEAQTGYRLKQYVSEGMAAKYGSYEEWQHDTGIYYDGETPVYLLVVLTNGVGNVDEFMGDLNLQINEWQEAVQ